MSKDSPFRSLFVALILGSMVFGTMQTSGHTGYDDENWPFKGNSWNRFVHDPDNDGLRDLWDPDNDGLPQGQFDQAAFTVGVYREPMAGAVSQANLLRQPIDYESPGLIFFESEYDFERGGAVPNEDAFYQDGAIQIPPMPYGSALSYMDFKPAALDPVYNMPFYQGGTMPPTQPCAQATSPRVFGLMDRPDAGEGGDALALAPGVDPDDMGYFDAVEGLNPGYPAYLETISAYQRYHMNSDGAQAAAGGNLPFNQSESDPTEITGAPDTNYVSLGHDGFVFANLTKPIFDLPGPDLRVHELGWDAESVGMSFGFYCIFGAEDFDGPYYLIGSATSGGLAEYDLATYYNRPDAIDAGGPFVRSIGIVSSFNNIHRLDADFTWTPDTPPGIDANGNYIHPIKTPVAPVRDQVVSFKDTSTRDGHPTWVYEDDGVWYADYLDESEDPISRYMWTFHAPSGAVLGKSLSKDPTFRFPEPGVYEVCHSVATSGTRYVMTPANIKSYYASFHNGILPFLDTVCKPVPVWNFDPSPTIEFSRVPGCVEHTWILTGTHTDPEDDPITYWNWTAGGTPLQGQTALHQFPGDGIYQLTLNVTDIYGGYGRAQASLSTMTESNTPPLLYNIPSRTIVVGTTIEFEIVALDSGCLGAEVSYYNLPPGARLVSESPPRFIWTPTETGLYPFNYEASDGQYTVKGETHFLVIQRVDDADDDGVGTLGDNCPGIQNHDQRDWDGDGIGDVCDPDQPPLVGPGGQPLIDDDVDDDGVPNHLDNCPGTYNPVVPGKGQLDLDGDGMGDMCDQDIDGDGIVQFTLEKGVIKDNCPYVSNADQRDSNGNGVGDACDKEYQEALRKAGCIGLDCPAEKTPLSEVAPKAESGIPSNLIVISAAVLLSAGLAAAWLVAEGVRGQKLKRR